jgi:plastocyanin
MPSDSVVLAELVGSVGGMMNLTSAVRRLLPLSVLIGGLALVANVSAAAAPNQSVVIDAFAFSPAEITVPVGGSVTWTNAQAGVPHTVTSADVTTFDSGVMASNDTFSFTFTQAGDFAYQCEIHPSMHGTVHVVAAAAAPDQSAAAASDASAAAADAAATPPQAAPAATSTSEPTAAPTVAPVVQPTATPAGYYGY